LPVIPAGMFAVQHTGLLPRGKAASGASPRCGLVW
jgi:hypothetical protein